MLHAWRSKSFHHGNIVARYKSTSLNFFFVHRFTANYALRIAILSTTSERARDRGGREGGTEEADNYCATRNPTKSGWCRLPFPSLSQSISSVPCRVYRTSVALSSINAKELLVGISYMALLHRKSIALWTIRVNVLGNRSNLVGKYGGISPPSRPRPPPAFPSSSHIRRSVVVTSPFDRADDRRRSVLCCFSILVSGDLWLAICDERTAVIKIGKMSTAEQYTLYKNGVQRRSRKIWSLAYATLHRLYVRVPLYVAHAKGTMALYVVDAGPRRQCSVLWTSDHARKSYDVL